MFFICITIISFPQDKKITDMKNKGEKEIVSGKNKLETEKIKANLTNVIVNTVCPVSGEKLEDNDHTFTYNGKTYGVCCNKCLTKIKKDPDKYISRLTPDGKSLLEK